MYNAIWLLGLFAVPALGQEQYTIDADSLQALVGLDTVVIKTKTRPLPVKLFTANRTQQFQINSGEHTLQYRPSNGREMGLGFQANSLKMNLAFDFKPRLDRPEDHLGLHINYHSKHHFMDYRFQHDKGFDVLLDGRQKLGSRPDMIRVSSQLNYMYLFNDSNYQVGRVRTSITDPGQTGLSYGLGGFALSSSQQQLGSLPVDTSTNSSTDADELNEIGGGLLTGLGGYFSLGGNLYSSVSINAGIGLKHSSINVSPSNVSADPILYQMRSSAVLGYVGKNYYLNLSMDLGYSNSHLFNNITPGSNNTQTRFSVGYKL